MNRRHITLFTVIAITAPSVSVHAFPGQGLLWAAPKPKALTRQEILFDAAKKLSVRAEEAAKRLGTQAQTHATTSRTSLKSTRAVALAHFKEYLQTLTPKPPEDATEAELMFYEPRSAADYAKAWLEKHADLVVDLGKILSSHVIEKAVPAGVQTRSDRMAETYTPVLAKTVAKKGTKLDSDAYIRALLTTSIKAHFFADKGTNLDMAADGLASTLAFFDAQVLTDPQNASSYFNITQGMQMLTARAVGLAIGVVASKAIGDKVDRGTLKTLVALTTRLCMEPLAALVEYGVQAVQAPSDES